MADDSLIAPNERDHLASVLKAAVGAVPVVGSLLAEAVGTLIPQQRTDRLAQFGAELAQRLADSSEDLLQRVRHSEEITGLLEEGLRQAAWSTSAERRSYLAELVSRGITEEEIECQESRHLLRILGDLNDVEVLWLRYLQSKDHELHNRNKQVFALTPPLSRKRALQDSYKDHLVSLNLLETFDADSSRPPRLTSIATQPAKRVSYRPTKLGELLLSQILDNPA